MKTFDRDLVSHLEQMRAELYGTPERKAATEERLAEMEAQRQRNDAQARSQRAVTLMVEGGVPRGVMDSAAEAFDTTEATIAASEAAAGKLRLAVLLGPPGEGKSTAAALACYEVALRGNRPMWTRPQDYADKYGAREFRAKCMGAQLLVVDDVGTEAASDYQRSEMLRAINDRHDRRLPTVITSNARNAAQLWKHLGGRVESRAKQGTRIVMCGGKDYRGR